MVGILLSLFARWGVAGRFQRPLAWLLAIVAPIGLLGLLWAIHGHWERAAYNRAFDTGWQALAKQDAAEATRAAMTNAAATAKADIERAADTITIQTAKEQRDAAIKAAPPAPTGAATRAANCVRWARAHPGATSRPAGC